MKYDGYYNTFADADRRFRMARRLGCRPETLALLSVCSSAALQICVAHDVRRNARKGQG